MRSHGCSLGVCGADDATASAAKLSVQLRSMSICRRHVDNDNVSDWHAKSRHRTTGIVTSTLRRYGQQPSRQRLVATPTAPFSIVVINVYKRFF